MIVLLLLSVYVSQWDMKTTAYCPCEICCGSWAVNRKTSTGTDAATRGIAAAPNVLPYGSVLDVPGYGVATVDDTGGAMRKSAKKQIIHIDLRMQSHEQARKWGVRYLRVGVIKYGRNK